VRGFAFIGYRKMGRRMRLFGGGLLRKGPAVSGEGRFAHRRLTVQQPCGIPWSCPRWFCFPFCTAFVVLFFRQNVHPA